MAGFAERIKNAWNAFMDRASPNEFVYNDVGAGTSYRPDRPRLSRGNERTIITAVFNRIAMDCAAVDIRHVRLDDNGRFKNEIDSGLNYCLTYQANIDQTGRELIQDIVMSMFDEGSVAVVPVDTSIDPETTGSFDILSLRTGKIVNWYPENVQVNIYNERSGQRENIILPKEMVAIIENPMYAIMNEPNSVLQRLIRKLNLLDVVDEQSSSGKLNLIVQLPYVIKTEARKIQADNRRKEIEDQLMSSKYGIAYTDGTEHITQLNRSIENNLMGQIEFLTNLLYSQLGVTTDILNGTANEVAMLNYNNRVIEPILSAIVEPMRIAFLTKTARTQKQSVVFFRDPFKLVPVNNLAEIADKFTRNEILSSNEVRAIIGYKPSDDPMADQLRNKNLNMSSEQEEQFFRNQNGYEEEDIDGEEAAYDESDYQSDLSELDSIDAMIDELERELLESGEDEDEEEDEV